MPIFKLTFFFITFSNELVSCINCKDESRTVSLYLALCSESTSTNSVLGRLRYIEAPHLKKFATETATYWHEALKEKFSKYLKKLINFISLFF